ncbi:2-amino-4-hydroxy-6-hydroxymethyldihydropteridine diphosphokinase [Enterovibrio norvegicus]|uniref:2-amino-4-hydroxy-6-hydroxymethyldihydropteridine pyrophosphokinase n=1 Tax=Enterovibrio norvegicus TaxID=188144 RepID=A0ABV4L896_9GAMM|nr:2-amino-4-hydroxy-6-hydroxymethyldihydropteridine diphosphokinase [Enterovibrio norvegicus]MCC4799616.1 2-amino-4-hydroxy-6-hydroxymethyldihydropteridine diphosphokinase [Enterovibrio norvegicus]OEF57391.1 2-amino-4-hydroxy-6-hydroxymethyldihydropteridine diphosphokinase [Enterovibrio norvegicus]OEF61116.1 2-amino-4-hydroxy-6-hydroxymethyldihydropteridine diphosphokinase [Enterovibrio norvegicus]PMH63916.1 2-amino-4-hydroxy-6-hydroxymethyldihydropteridine diphosphokinase [Enterovibrio norveg
MIRVYIAIGSNLGNPVEKASLAIDALKQLPNTQFVCCSSLYSSKPMGPSDQPDYVNAVAIVDTLLKPLDLLDQTQRIELEFGRERKDERWGPRTLDLDILLFGDLQINSERLTVPHYGMKVREFVLYPLAEIAPDLHLPDGSAVTDLVAVVDKNGLTAIA